MRFAKVILLTCAAAAVSIPAAAQSGYGAAQDGYPAEGGEVRTGPASIQDGQPLTGDAFIAYLKQLQAATQVPKNMALLGVQSAPTPTHGSAFVSLSGSANFRRKPRLDGSLSMGLGLGDMATSVGISPSVSINSVYTNPGDSGSFGIKLARELDFAPVPTYAAVSFDQLLGWGEASSADPSITAVVTSYTDVSPFGDGETYPIGVSLGVGSQANGGNFGVLAGVGVGLTENLGTSIAWDGDQINLGMGLKFEELPNVSISTTFNDVFNQAENQGVTVSVSFSSDIFNGVF